MAGTRKQYSYLIKLSVADGCFSSDDDLLQYIRFRLGLRSRDSDNISLVDVTKTHATNVQEVFL